MPIKLGREKELASLSPTFDVNSILGGASEVLTRATF